MADGVNPIWRGLASFFLIVFGPIAVVLLFLFADHRYPAMSDVAGWMWLAAAWAIGIIGIHLLPADRIYRALIATIYTPIAGFAIGMTVLVIGCSWYGECI
ncbi:hypothetical protein [Sphingomonas sp.]|jgi:hypothetical protein|uniref:hypothetical protein n=1 Tax=Sphingomonas sp. TaxID=28214 RepID=UPI002E3096BB|nr:hypothetical protein [Sphingomonas sp.]HEX4695735.1 hypothetical protein [Sphingomonas sp.]